MYRNELQTYYSFWNCRSSGETNTKLNSWINGQPQQVALEQESPLNLCLRDEHSLERSLFNKDLSQVHTTCASNGMEWFSHLVDSKLSWIPKTEWSDELYPAMSQTDSGVVETDTESVSHISPPATSHCVGVPSAPTDNSALFTSTPRRHGLGSPPCSRKQEPVDQPRSKQVSVMSRPSAAVRMSGRHSQLSSARCTRRRRVGWRGVAMCAACGMVCSGMDHLNGHFAMFHLHLLGLEWKLSQYNSTKTSKLLFQVSSVKRQVQMIVIKLLRLNAHLIFLEKIYKLRLRKRCYHCIGKEILQCW